MEGVYSCVRAPALRVSLLFQFVLLSQVVPLLGLSTPANRTTPLVPALIVFGDSIVDPGNNNALKTIVKCNFPPYGMDFPGQVPTGRFCNGRTTPDFLASKLGIKEYVPAYLGTELSPEDLLTGVSFGSGGAGYDPLTSQLVSVLTMPDQLELFKEYKEKVIALAGEERGEAILSQAVYGTCVGTCDFVNNYFATPFRKAHYDLPSYINFVVDKATSFIEDLIQLGARKIAFVGLPPLGCVPSQRTLAGGITRECEPIRNEAAESFNTKMAGVSQSLTNKYQGQGILVVYLDIYHPLLDFIQHPSKYGFVEATKGCCGTGTVEVSILCNKFTPVTCEDDTKYVFWDSYHLTERAYDVITDILIQNYIQYLT